MAQKRQLREADPAVAPKVPTTQSFQARTSAEHATGHRQPLVGEVHVDMRAAEAAAESLRSALAADQVIVTWGPARGIVVSGAEKAFGGVRNKSVTGAVSMEAAQTEILRRATEVIGSEDAAMRWMGAPVRALNYATPISMLHDKSGFEAVRVVLGRLEHGVL